jgi:hypothetical protein
MAAFRRVRRVRERFRRASQGKVVFLEVNNLPLARKVLERALQVARLARPEAERCDQIVETKKFFRGLLKDFEDLGITRELAH